MRRIVLFATLALLATACADARRPEPAKVAGRKRMTPSPSGSPGAARAPAPGETKMPLRMFIGSESAVAGPVRVCRGKACVSGGGTVPGVRAPASTVLSLAVDRVPRRAWLELKPSRGAARRVGLTPGTLMSYAAMPGPGSYRLTVVLSWADLDGVWGFELLLTER